MKTRTFFRLVISSVMRVRITSATSSIVRTCSWNDGQVSTTTNAYDSRNVSRTFLMFAPVMSSAASGVGGAGLDEELARAGEHRAPPVVLLALDAHHDDRRFRNGVRDDLGRRDAVHVRHVDVHEDDVGALFLRELDGLIAAVRGRHDRHIRLETDELREVFARLRDVVDNEDADLVSHGRDS